MDYLILEHVPPYDGRYEWDLEGRELTTREWGWIKRLAGYLPLNIEDGLGDPELIAVFAAIALRRAGKVETNEVPRAFEYLSDAPFDGSRIRLETDTVEEDDAGPSSSKLELERRHFWNRFDSELGTIDGDPGGLWDARLGYFNVGPADVGDMTPAQLLGCVELFNAMHGAD